MTRTIRKRPVARVSEKPVYLYSITSYSVLESWYHMKRVALNVTGSLLREKTRKNKQNRIVSTINRSVIRCDFFLGIQGFWLKNTTFITLFNTPIRTRFSKMTLTIVTLRIGMRIHLSIDVPFLAKKD
jgi:hypothetical protein